jgi:hypothetical protein
LLHRDRLHRRQSLGPCSPCLGSDIEKGASGWSLGGRDLNLHSRLGQGRPCSRRQLSTLR